MRPVASEGDCIDLISQFNCRYLVYAGCIKPLCDLLNVNEVKIIKVAMEGLENILKVSHGL